MIRALLLSILVAWICGPQVLFSAPPGNRSQSISSEGPVIGVLLLEGVFQGSVSSDAGSLILQWQSGQVVVDSPLSFEAADGALQVGDRLFRESVRIRATAGDMQIGHRMHEGWVEWIPDAPYSGSWKLIERLPMERYLIGVVSREMSASSFPASALEAQAVAARTYSYFQYRTRNRSRRHHVYGDTRSQAYGGTARVPQEVIDAVEKTRGMILLTSGQIFESFYHSTCGGRTCSAAEAFGMADVSSMRSVSCAGCEGSRFSSWRREVEQTEILRALEDVCEGTGVTVGTVKQLVPVETAQSGHVPYIRVVHSSGSFEVETQRLRTALASSGGGRLRSSSFQVLHTADRFVFDGKGWGHGVGMCQVGARGYALRGANRTWILQHYYPGAQIRRLW